MWPPVGMSLTPLLSRVRAPFHRQLSGRLRDAPAWQLTGLSVVTSKGCRLPGSPVAPAFAVPSPLPSLRRGDPHSPGEGPLCVSEGTCRAQTGSSQWAFPTSLTTGVLHGCPRREAAELGDFWPFSRWDGDQALVSPTDRATEGHWPDSHFAVTSGERAPNETS